jgi:hypothetical protein
MLGGVDNDWTNLVHLSGCQDLNFLTTAQSAEQTSNMQLALDSSNDKDRAGGKW